MARFSLLPREEHFFHDFVGLAEEIRVGARTLKQMVASNPPDLAKADAIKDIEHACDGRTRSIIDRLNRTFVTPLDREDIHALAISLDDVMDAIDAAAAGARLYNVHHVRTGAHHYAKSTTRRPAHADSPTSSANRPIASPKRFRLWKIGAACSSSRLG